MLISLYTSRVILNALGVEDYGIYNVVGGVVAMFSMISASLNSAISRFITYELGIGDLNKLKKVFSSSVTIQIGLAVFFLLIVETVGVWFVNYKMVIPVDRLVAANWCLQLSAITFAINLISVPYNAAIIAHEKMSAFAYISIIEAVGKLLIAWLILISPIDKLIFYAIMLAFMAIVIRYIYMYYCKRFLCKVIEIGNHREKIYNTSSKLTMEEMTEFLNKIKADAATELGITLPLPEDRFFEQFYNQFNY
jgi:O-antigen/teichoic acid export membrane protein